MHCSPFPSSGETEETDRAVSNRSRRLGIGLITLTAKSRGRHWPQRATLFSISLSKKKLVRSILLDGLDAAALAMGDLRFAMRSLSAAALKKATLRSSIRAEGLARNSVGGDVMHAGDQVPRVLPTTKNARGYL